MVPNWTTARFREYTMDLNLFEIEISERLVMSEKSEMRWKVNPREAGGEESS